MAFADGSLAFLEIFTDIIGMPSDYLLVSLWLVLYFGAHLQEVCCSIILKKLGADPASSSAPFVATLVDVTGLIIYFTVASNFYDEYFIVTRINFSKSDVELI